MYALDLTVDNVFTAVTKAVTLLGHRVHGGIGTWGLEKYMTEAQIQSILGLFPQVLDVGTVIAGLVLFSDVSW